MTAERTTTRFGGDQRLTVLDGGRAVGPRVMLVDDDAMIREAFVEVMREEGYDVVTAGDG